MEVRINIYIYLHNLFSLFTKCFGTGHYERKMKHLENQKEGKRRMKRMGTVDLPQEAFFDILSNKKWRWGTRLDNIKSLFFFGFLVGLQSPLPPPSSSLCTYLLQQSAKRDTCRYSCDSGPVLFRPSPWPQHLRSMVTEIPKTWNMPSICLCEYVKTALLFSIIDCLDLVVARAQSPSAQFSGALVFGSLDYIFHKFSSVNYHIKFSARQFWVVQQLWEAFFLQFADHLPTVCLLTPTSGVSM